MKEYVKEVGLMFLGIMAIVGIILSVFAVYRLVTPMIGPNMALPSQLAESYNAGVTAGMEAIGVEMERQVSTTGGVRVKFSDGEHLLIIKDE